MKTGSAPAISELVTRPGRRKGAEERVEIDRDFGHGRAVDLRATPVVITRSGMAVPPDQHALLDQVENPYLGYETLQVARHLGVAVVLQPRLVGDLDCQEQV